jgi:hypothetical protein
LMRGTFWRKAARSPMQSLVFSRILAGDTNQMRIAASSRPAPRRLSVREPVDHAPIASMPGSSGGKQPVLQCREWRLTRVLAARNNQMRITPVRPPRAVDLPCRATAGSRVSGSQQLCAREGAAACVVDIHTLSLRSNNESAAATTADQGLSGHSNQRLSKITRRRQIIGSGRAAPHRCRLQWRTLT